MVTWCRLPVPDVEQERVNSSDEVYQDFDVTATDFDKISMNKIDSNDTVATVNREVCEVISDKDFLRRTQRNKRGDRLIKRYEELDDDE